MTAWMSAQTAPTGVHVSRAANPKRIAVATTAFALIVGLGCTSEAPIVVEQVPNEEIGAAPAAQPVTRTDRMLAAIVPHGESAIFFKMTGPEAKVAGEKAGFLEAVRSVTFDGDTPQWTLPDGWTQATGDGRELLATVTVPADPPLSMAITSLPLWGDDTEFRLTNVNRWRRQMGLRPMAPDQLHAGGDLNEETIEIPLDDGTKATLVNIAGQFQSGGMTPPFAGGASGTTPSPAGMTEATADNAEAGSSGPTYEVPEGWKDQGTEGISVATFLAGDTRTTVIPLSAEANAVPPNINRWRKEVGLPELEEPAVDGTLETVTLGDGKDGKYVELVGPTSSDKPQAILGVIAYRDDDAWFVTMKGDADAVQEETANFKSFVSSLRFSPGGK